MNSILNKRNLNEAHEQGTNGESHFNCWNATLYVLGQTDELYWSDIEEIEDFLWEQTSEIFHLKIGDILVLYGYSDDWDLTEEEREDRIIHTAVYIGKGLWFHKKGEDESEYVTEQEVKDVYAEYERTETRRIKTLTKV